MLLNLKAKLTAAILITSSFAAAAMAYLLLWLPENASSGPLRDGGIIIPSSIILFCVLIVSALISWRLYKPLDDLVIGMQVISSGDLDYRIKKRKNDELGSLSDSFNLMAGKLKESLKEQGRYSAMAAVEKNKALLIIDSMADPLIVTDRKHLITLINPAAEALFETSLKKTIGKHIVNFLKKYRLESLWGEFPEEDRIIPPRQRRIRVKELEMWPQKRILKARLAPLRDEARHINGMVIVFEDITKHKEIDAMKTEFVSIVSHELKTPLTSIKGYAALLKDGRLGLMAEKQEKAVKVINDESDRLGELIDDILDISKLESGKTNLNIKKNSIRAAFEDSPMVQLSQKKGIRLISNFEEGLDEIEFDKVKITQVFTNILSNAVKFTPEGGTITVSAKGLGDFVRVDITDTGIGISKSDMPKMFNKFFQAESHLRRMQGGTGLGLPIVKRIIAIHHGLLSVASKPGKGTTMSFALPIRPTPSGEPSKCWEEKACKKIACPAYNNSETPCYLVQGTFCRKGNKMPVFDKIQICKDCPVYLGQTGTPKLPGKSIGRGKTRLFLKNGNVGLEKKMGTG